MEFILTDQQQFKIEEWQSTLPVLDKKYCTIDGGYFEYTFIPIGTGILVSIKRVDGYELDLTDYLSLL